MLAAQTAAQTGGRPWAPCLSVAARVGFQTQPWQRFGGRLFSVHRRALVENRTPPGHCAGLSDADFTDLHCFSPALDAAALAVLQTAEPDCPMAFGFAHLPYGCNAPNLDPGSEVYVGVWTSQSPEEEDVAAALQSAAAYSHYAARLALGGDDARQRQRVYLDARQEHSPSTPESLAPLLGWGQAQQGDRTLCYLVWGRQQGTLLSLMSRAYHGPGNEFLQKVFGPAQLTGMLATTATALHTLNKKHLLFSDLSLNSFFVSHKMKMQLGAPMGLVPEDSVHSGLLAIYHTKQYHVERLVGALQSTDAAAFGVVLLSVGMFLLGLPQLGLTPGHLNSSGFGPQLMAEHVHRYCSQQLVLLGQLHVACGHTSSEVAYHMLVLGELLTATGPDGECLGPEHMCSGSSWLHTMADELEQALGTGGGGMSAKACHGLLTLLHLEHQMLEVLHLRSGHPAADMVHMWHQLQSPPTQFLLQEAAGGRMEPPLPRAFSIARQIYQQCALQPAVDWAAALAEQQLQGFAQNWQGWAAGAAALQGVAQQARSTLERAACELVAAGLLGAGSSGGYSLFERAGLQPCPQVAAIVQGHLQSTFAFEAMQLPADCLTPPEYTDVLGPLIAHEVTIQAEAAAARAAQAAHMATLPGHEMYAEIYRH